MTRGEWKAFVARQPMAEVVAALRGRVEKYRQEDEGEYAVDIMEDALVALEHAEAERVADALERKDEDCRRDG